LPNGTKAWTQIEPGATMSFVEISGCREEVRMRSVVLIPGACLVFGLCFLFCAVPVAAFPTSGPLSDWLIVYDPVGAVYASVSVSEDVEDPGQIYYIDIPGLTDDLQFGNGTTLIEPGVQPTWYSDIFGVADMDLGHFILGFSSDTDTVPSQYGSQGTIFLVETLPGNFDATGYLAPGLRDQGYTAVFHSDAVVPEPGTSMLLASGLLGIALYVRRRRRA
jgi:hypothetical protein